jgi:hypothetical protein
VDWLLLIFILSLLTKETVEGVDKCTSGVAVVALHAVDALRANVGGCANTGSALRKKFFLEKSARMSTRQSLHFDITFLYCIVSNSQITHLNG